MLNKLAPATKAVAAFVGSVATALLGLYGPDTTIGHVLTIVVAVATALAVFQFPNTPEVVDMESHLEDTNP